MPSVIPIFPLRLPLDVKLQAMAKAAELGVSLNGYVVQAVVARLAAGDGVSSTPSSPVVRRVREVRISRSAQPRNARCACGSGLKFKRCCGAA